MVTRSASRRRVIGAVAAAIATGVALFAVGCSSGPVLVGSRPPSAYEVVGPASGGACGVLLFSIIPIQVNSRTKRAYADALADKGTALINTEIQNSWWYIPYVGPMYCTTVLGTAIRERP